MVMYDQYTPPARVGGPSDMDWRGLAGSKSDKLSDRYLATKTPNIDSHQTRYYLDVSPHNSATKA